MHTLSHWHASLDRDPLPTDDLPTGADVLVIGAGVLGACTALALARAGAAPLLIDQGGPAAGATGHNGGLVSAGTAEGYPAAVARLGRAAARAIWELSRDGVDQLAALMDEEGIDAGFERSGSLTLALSPAQREHMAGAVRMLREDGFAVEELGRAQVQSLVATPLGPTVLGARFNPFAGKLHSARLVYGLLAAARRHGARLAWGVAARALRPDGSGVIVETERGPLRAGAVVVAANAWSADLLPHLSGVITPVRGQALVTTPLPPLLAPGFGAALTPTGEYGQQRPDGRVIFGGCRADAPGRDIGVREQAPSSAVQDALDAALAQLFPALAGAPIERRWGGLMAFTPDYLPLAGRLPALPVWYAGGFCGHGMPFAAPLGQALAAASLGASPPPALAHFAPDRPTLA